MNQIKKAVEEKMTTIDDDLKKFDEVLAREKEAAERQASSLHETSNELIPLLKKIRERRIFFQGVETKYRSTRGPVLGHDIDDNALFIYDIDRESPIRLDLYDDEEKLTSWINIIKRTGYVNAIISLKNTLTLIDNIMIKAEENISELNSDLNKYDK
ncbi:hypothetical protein [Jeotgalibacillus aurantiacus]|uniref:hypothetical protein n=1 Tax=Jeotgalibacillus aurantiacus TaxID=2763266 RepID=UPI001D0B90A4|nr:hypothetical protein [Jeotgalibacillus aurantiacus]